MYESERLPVMLFDLESATSRLSVGVEPLSADQLIEVAHGLTGVHCASRLA